MEIEKSNPFKELKEEALNILEKSDDILKETKENDPKTIRLNKLVNKEINRIKDKWEEDGKKDYEKALNAKKTLENAEENPEEFKRRIESNKWESLNHLEDEEKETKLSKLVEKEKNDLKEKTPESYLKEIKEKLNEFKEESNELPPMDLKTFKQEIYDKSPKEIKPINITEEGETVYLNEWYNAIFDDKKLLSWKNLPIEPSRKLFFYKGYESLLENYKEYYEKIIEMLEANIDGFLKAAMENNDVELIVDAVILLNKLGRPEIVSFIKDQMERLKDSPKISDQEKLISISEKISHIKIEGNK